MSALLEGALAGVSGGAVTAAGTWGAMLFVERRRENLELMGALDMLRVEREFLSSSPTAQFEADISELLPLGWEEASDVLKKLRQRLSAG